MNRFKPALLVPGVTLLLLASTSLASAESGKVESSLNRGPLVNAWFTSFDATGCVETDVFVSANRPTEHRTGAAATTTGIGSVSIFRYDMCTETALLDAVGETDALASGDLTVSNQLDSATLRATIALTDVDTGATFPVTVDMIWTGTSDITRDHSNTNDNYGGGCHVINRWHGSGRTADATGSVTDGTEDFTPEASTSAEIGFVIGGFHVMGCA